MKQSTWRDKLAPIIAEVIECIGRSDMKELRRELKHAWPLGERANWPYKVWLDEIRRQLGMRRLKLKPKWKRKPEELLLPDEERGQRHLFELN